MKTTIIQCDIQGCDCQEKVMEKRSLQVIFTTEQTEGRPCKPYLAMHTLDICPEHYDMILKGAAIFGAGAQGHNKYTINGNT